MCGCEHEFDYDIHSQIIQVWNQLNKISKRLFYLLPAQTRGSQLLSSLQYNDTNDVPQ